ncbi:short-chain dehydrogenase [Flavobacterium gelidilacus]|jgi:membrane protein YqaA with SNARE-associated domain|uniref:YqaA family protein n=1 Tax=Flavobacterium gelidilacus TaxID=206041 RepID=UPI0004193F6B|nr:short-chain dehydrogenase [Flavobacterium gelidilacus]
MSSTKKSRFKLLHQYYKYTGFYSFIWQGLKKAIIPTLLIVGVLFYVNEKVMNLNDAMVYATKNFSDFFLFSIFLLSESILGLIPPDIFIAWTKNTDSPLLYLSILAFLSYSGGVIAYFMGKALASIPSINRYMYGKMTKHIINMQKWGGFLIIVGALLPLPFAMACLAAGMINFSRKHFFLFSLFRIFRFVIYGYVIYAALS